MFVFHACRKSLLATLLVLLLASCTIFSGRETTGQYADDVTITTKVKDAFIADPLISASEIHVETMQGVVQLSGFIDSPKSEARAVELARQVKGVKQVKDDIIIRGSSSKNY